MGNGYSIKCCFSEMVFYLCSYIPLKLPKPFLQPCFIHLSTERLLFDVLRLRNQLVPFVHGDGAPIFPLLEAVVELRILSPNKITANLLFFFSVRSDLTACPARFVPLESRK
jgi:hypothetical protein